MKRFLIFMVRVYQRCISPIMPGKCRFTPTCSAYFIEALQKYGFYRGTYLGIKRILKCHPFHEGGYDPLR